MSSLVCRTVVSRRVRAGSAAVTSRWSHVGTGMWMLSIGRGGQDWFEAVGVSSVSSSQTLGLGLNYLWLGSR